MICYSIRASECERVGEWTAVLYACSEQERKFIVPHSDRYVWVAAAVTATADGGTCRKFLKGQTYKHTHKV